jgi:transposase
MADHLPDTLPQTLSESHALLRQLAQEKADLARRQREAEQAAAHERARAQHAEDEVARLKKALKDFVRRQQGRKSEQLDPEQYALGFEDIEENIARAEEAARNGKAGTGAARRAPRRNQGALPKDLPRYEVVVEPEHDSCPCCGGELHVIDETKTEQLDAEPAKVYVKVIRRPTYGCRSCESAPVQAEAPASPVDGGLPTCGTVAQVLTAKYADALPLYRQAEMLARQGIDLDRSTLARWAGTAAHHLRPVHEELMRQVMASTKLFADETPAPTLEAGAHPGEGQADHAAGVPLGLRPGRHAVERPGPAGGCLPLRHRPRPGSSRQAPKGLYRHAPGRRVSRLQRRRGATGERGDRARPLLGAYQAADLQAARQRQRADGDRSAAVDRPALRHRGRDPRQRS